MLTHVFGVRGRRNVAVVATLALAIAACAAPPASAPAAPAANAPAAAEEITVYNNNFPASIALMDFIKAEFVKTHPNVKITVNAAGSGDFAEAMFAKGAANNLEDIVFNADLFVPPFVDANLLVDMEPLAKADSAFSVDDIYPSILGLGKVGFKPGIYMLPSG